MGFTGSVAPSLSGDQKLNLLFATSYQGWVEVSCQDGKTSCHLQELLTLESLYELSRKKLFLYQPTSRDPDRPPVLVVMGK